MGKTNKEILALAIPAIVSNITTPLLGLVDTAITGHLGSAAYIGAIAVGGSMFSMVYWLFAFLRMGTSGLTAQEYGRIGNTQIVLWRAMSVSILAAAALILASPLISWAFLAFMDADQLTTEFAAQYFQIVIFGAPAVLGTYSLSGWLLGMQDSKSPMWMALITNVANIAISVVLVYGFGMKIAGVAIGTLSAQWIGFLSGMAIARVKYGILAGKIDSARSIFDKKAIKRFFNVNADIFLRTLCLVAVTVWFTRTGASMGDNVLAANAVLMQLFILFSYFMDGFAFSGEALAGKYYGQNNRSGLMAVVKGVFAWGAVVAFAFTIAYALGGNWIMSVITDDQAVVEVAQRYLPWAVAVPLAGVVAFVWDGIFIGLTYTRQMLASMAIATAAFFIIYFLIFRLWGNHALWLAFITYLFLRGTTQTLLFLHKNK